MFLLPRLFSRNSEFSPSRLCVSDNRLCASCSGVFYAELLRQKDGNSRNAKFNEMPENAGY